MVIYLHDNELSLLHKYSIHSGRGILQVLAGGTLWSALMISTRIWSGVPWLRWQSVEVRLDRLPRALGFNPPWRV